MGERRHVEQAVAGGGGNRLRGGIDARGDGVDAGQSVEFLDAAGGGRAGGDHRGGQAQGAAFQGAEFGGLGSGQAGLVAQRKVHQDGELEAGGVRFQQLRDTAGDQAVEEDDRAVGDGAQGVGESLTGGGFGARPRAGDQRLPDLVGGPVLRSGRTSGAGVGPGMVGRRSGAGVGPGMVGRRSGAGVGPGMVGRRSGAGVGCRREEGGRAGVGVGCRREGGGGTRVGVGPGMVGGGGSGLRAYRRKGLIVGGGREVAEDLAVVAIAAARCCRIVDGRRQHREQRMGHSVRS
ncbi:hypothetical protein MB27_41090 [Actinoplanes utahensis]|uniref:Uncharacterized protein n=1 Tax=Actinoplanes utahensis TaxID=1869 RepID=A0A0A6UA08_ACTUT|nr:hypothetical protein MB27_41090 [Actinoplanes utahensis]